jgi:hypothetical protein
MRLPARNRDRAKSFAVVALVLAVLTSGAFAFWQGAGHGTATATLGSPIQLTLTPGVAEAQLVPGDNSSVDVIATNPNPYFVQIRSLTLDTSVGAAGFDVDAGHSGCGTSAIHFVPQSNGGGGWNVPPKVAQVNGTLEIGMADALHMDLNAASACQNAIFTVHLAEGS